MNDNFFPTLKAKKMKEKKVGLHHAYEEGPLSGERKSATLIGFICFQG